MTEYTYFPRNDKLSEFQDKLDSTFWSADEVDYDSDRIVMSTLENLATIENKQEKIGDVVITSEQAKNIIEFVKNVLCLFAQLDGVVIENLVKNFTTEISRGEKEIEQFYIAQAHNELVHSKSYGMQVETLIKDKQEKLAIYQAALKYKAVKAITDWTLTWFDTSLPVMDRLIAFCCVEGIIFTSGFVAIYRLKEWGLFVKGLCNANEFISKDEAVHTDAGIYFYHHKADKGELARLSTERVYEIVDAAVVLASTFSDEAINPELVGLDSEDMKKYIRLAADKLLLDLKYPKKYNIPENPFKWMEKIAMFNISNMFESKVTAYRRGLATEDTSDGWDKPFQRYAVENKN